MTPLPEPTTGFDSDLLTPEEVAMLRPTHDPFLGIFNTFAASNTAAVAIPLLTTICKLRRKEKALMRIANVKQMATGFRDLGWY